MSIVVFNVTNGRSLSIIFFNLRLSLLYLKNENNDRAYPVRLFQENKEKKTYYVPGSVPST